MGIVYLGCDCLFYRNTVYQFLHAVLYQPKILEERVLK